MKPLRQATLCQIETRLQPMLPPGCLDNNPAKAHSRSRLLPLDRTFWCWLWQILQCNTACREVMKQLSMLLNLHGRSMAENSSAYCQSRKLIPLELLRRIYIHIAQKAWSQTPQSHAFCRAEGLKPWTAPPCGWPILQPIRRTFPKASSQKAGTGFPVMKIAALFCIGSGAILAHATGSLWTSELSLVAQLLGFLSPQDVLIADRGFCNYALVALLGQNQVDVIARVPTTVRKIDFRKGKRLGSKDALFVWNKPKARCKWLSLDQWLGLPRSLTVRVLRVRVRLPGIRVREITLMTTLLDPCPLSSQSNCPGLSTALASGDVL